MILVIGGAYQGKLDYVMENYPGKSVFQCDTENTDMNISTDVVNSLHLMALAHIRKGTDALAYLQEKLPSLKNKIVICDDISCGVVPIDSEMRRWRETTGRCLALLSKNADEVVRVFCGIGSRIK
jgi:Adenosyl cobinamide kinase/adenosyl cobinamide phosphate guanylyltransferase